MMSGHKMGRLLAAGILTAGAAGVLCGCAYAGDLTKITFCLDWTPNTNHTGLYAAQALGYYEDAGLEVEIVQPPENGAVLMCAAGQAEFAVDAQDTMAAALDRDEPLGITAVAGLIQHNTSGILSRAGEGMDRPKGMDGKTYSTWESPIELKMIEYVMEQDGGDFSTVTLIPNDITDEPAALAAHQTDCVWVFYGWSGINAEVEDIDCDYWAFGDISPALDYYTPVIVANDSFLEESPGIAKAFLEATAKGYAYAIEHPEEAAGLLIEGDTTGSLEGSEDLVYASQEWISDFLAFCRDGKVPVERQETSRPRTKNARGHDSAAHDCAEPRHFHGCVRRHNVDIAFERGAVSPCAYRASRRVRVRRHGRAHRAAPEGELQARRRTRLPRRLRELRRSTRDVHVLLAYRGAGARGLLAADGAARPRLLALLRALRLLPPRAVQHDARAADASLLEALLHGRPRAGRVLDGAHAGNSRARARREGQVPGAAGRPSQSVFRNVHAPLRRRADGLAAPDDFAQVRPHQQEIPASGDGCAAARRRSSHIEFLDDGRRDGGPLRPYRSGDRNCFFARSRPCT